MGLLKNKYERLSYPAPYVAVDEMPRMEMGLVMLWCWMLAEWLL